MPNVSKTVQEEFEEAMRMKDEFEAKRELLKKKQKDPNYLTPKCTDEELKDIFGGN